MKTIGTIAVVLFLAWLADSSLLDPVIENVRHIKATYPPEKVPGMWRKKMLWKPRWVKEWKQSNVLRPVWKKFWGPVIIREWVPIPKPPPDWDPHAAAPASHLGGAATPFGQDTTFFDVGDPPKPNLSYLQKPSQALANPFSSGPQKQTYSNYAGNQVQGGAYSGASAGFNHAPPLPISTAVTQAESYSGHSSYGLNGDSSAFDLNPPVDAYNPQHGGYGLPQHSGHGNAGYDFGNQHGHHSGQANAVGFANNNAGYDLSNQHGHHSGQGGASGYANINTGYDSGNQNGHHPGQTHPSTHGGSNNHGYHHHHHHHHHHEHGVHDHHGSYSHNYDQSRAPPARNTWKPLPPNPASPSSTLLQQASSAVSVVSKLPTSIQPLSGLNSGFTNYLRPPGLHAPNNDFIQQASLVGEYHYADNALTRHTPGTSIKLEPAPPKPVAPPKPTAAPPKPAGPPHKPPVAHKPSSTPNKQLNHATKPHEHVPATPPHKATHGTSKPHEHIAPRAKPPPTTPSSQTNLKPLPPTSVSTFHFIEAIPSNHTQSKASLIGNLNKTLSADQQQSNRVSIITPRPYKKESRPNIAKLAHSIVEQHLKAAQKVNPSTTVDKPVSSTEPTVTSTSSSIKNSLTNYLINEGPSEKAPKVFIVTPTPQKKIER